MRPRGLTRGVVVAVLDADGVVVEDDVLAAG